MKKLSVVISAYNEEKNIRDCLDSVKWADEIILVNNESTDKTVDIALSIGREVKIFTRPNQPMLNINKNYGFSKATGEWILSLDADERVTPELREEIRRIIGNCPAKRDPALREKLPARWQAGEIGDSASAVGFSIPRKNIIFGKWIKHTGWYPDRQLRLFRRGKGKFPAKHVHEMIEVEGKTAELRNHFLHYNYQTVSQFIYKLDRIYTENEAENLIKDGYQLKRQDALRFPAQEFIRRFFAQEGYKDGFHGLILSLLMAFYHLVVFAKIWEKQGFKDKIDKNFLKETTDEFKNLGRKFKHWLLEVKLKTEKNFFKKIIVRFFKMV